MRISDAHPNSRADAPAPVQSVSPSLPAQASPQPPKIDVGPDLGSRALYLNRELSWLEFNARVLSEADGESVPLLERLKVSRDSVEQPRRIFMVRVAGLKQQITGEVDEMGRRHDRRRATLGRRNAGARTRRGSGEKLLRPPSPLADAGILFVKPVDLPPQALKELDERFDNEVFPILTPIAIDPGHPFPQVRNKSLNLAVTFKRQGTTDRTFGVVQVPSMLRRLLPSRESPRKTGNPRLVHTCCSKISSLDTSRRYFQA